MKVKRFFYWFPTILWTIFIFVMGSSQLNDNENSKNFIILFFSRIRKYLMQRNGTLEKIIYLNLDKIYHFIQYLILTLLVYFSAKKDLKKDDFFNLKFVLLFILIISVLDEIHQVFISYRSCSMFDFFADMLGVFMLYVYLKLKKRGFNVT